MRRGFQQLCDSARRGPRGACGRLSAGLSTAPRSAYRLNHEVAAAHRQGGAGVSTPPPAAPPEEAPPPPPPDPVIARLNEVLTDPLTGQVEAIDGLTLLVDRERL